MFNKKLEKTDEKQMNIVKRYGILCLFILVTLFPVAVLYRDIPYNKMILIAPVLIFVMVAMKDKIVWCKFGCLVVGMAYGMIQVEAVARLAYWITDDAAFLGWSMGESSGFVVKLIWGIIYAIWAFFINNVKKEETE